MRLNEIVKKSLEADAPSQSAEQLLSLCNGSRPASSALKARPIPLLAALCVLLALSVGAAAGVGALAKRFGETPSGVQTPKIINQSCEGEFSVSYTEAWYSAGRLYLAGEIVTPEPLDPEAHYVICPTIYVNDVKITAYDSMWVYPNGTHSSFVQPLTIAEANDSETLKLTIELDALEDWSAISNSGFNKADVTVYSVSCFAELELSPTAPLSTLEPNLTDGELTIDKISVTELTLLVEGSGLVSRRAALELSDGSLVMGCATDSSVIFRFDELGIAESAKALILADDFYTIEGDTTLHVDNGTRIPLK